MSFMKPTIDVLLITIGYYQAYVDYNPVNTLVRFKVVGV